MKLSELQKLLKLISFGVSTSKCHLKKRLTSYKIWSWSWFASSGHIPFKYSNFCLNDYSGAQCFNRNNRMTKSKISRTIWHCAKDKQNPPKVLVLPYSKQQQECPLKLKNSALLSTPNWRRNQPWRPFSSWGLWREARGDSVALSHEVPVTPHFEAP